jgi:hypothetical protein
MKFISELPNIVKCSYSEEHKSTIHEWTSFFCTPQESILMRNTLEDFLNFVKDNEVTKHIVDVKKCTDTFIEEDLKYITDYLVPKEIEYGILYLANIVSEDLITQVTTDFWQEEVKDGLLVKNFETIDEALKWLSEK